MNLRHLATAAETHLNDLQADVEAGSRQLENITEAGTRIRDALFRQQLAQAALMGTLMTWIAELRTCVSQQRETMRELRHDIRRMRTLTKS